MRGVGAVASQLPALFRLGEVLITAQTLARFGFGHWRLLSNPPKGRQYTKRRTAGKSSSPPTMPRSQVARLLAHQPERVQCPARQLLRVALASHRDVNYPFGDDLLHNVWLAFVVQ